MQCIACGNQTKATAIRAGIEAAFCHYHYPLATRPLTITLTIQF